MRFLIHCISSDFVLSLHFILNQHYVAPVKRVLINTSQEYKTKKFIYPSESRGLSEADYKWSGGIRHRLSQLESGYGKISMRKVHSDHQNIPSFLVLMMFVSFLHRYCLLLMVILTSKVKLPSQNFNFPPCLGQY